MLRNFPRLDYWVRWAGNWHRWRAAPAPGEESKQWQWTVTVTCHGHQDHPGHPGHLATLAPCQINQLPGLSLPSPGRDSGLGWAGVLSTRRNNPRITITTHTWWQIAANPISPYSIHTWCMSLVCSWRLHIWKISPNLIGNCLSLYFLCVCIDC